MQCFLVASLVSTRPVSYTLLDVYKRQLLAFVAFAGCLAETGAFPVAEALLAVLGSGIGLNRMKL